MGGLMLHGELLVGMMGIDHVGSFVCSSTRSIAL